MGIFPMSVANNFCDMPLSKYIDSKTVLIYRPHPVDRLLHIALSKLECELWVSNRYSWCLDQYCIERYHFRES